MPGMVLGALLGTSVASLAAPGLWAGLRGDVGVIHQEVATLRALSQTLPPRQATVFQASLDRVEGAAHRVEAGLRAHARPQRGPGSRDVWPDGPLPGAIVLPPADPEPVGPVPMDPADFARVRQSVGSASFSGDRLERLGDALQGRYLTVDQVIALLEVFSFEQTKIDAAVLMYPQIVDPGEWYRVFDAFTFSSSKDALRERTSGSQVHGGR